MSLSIGTQFGAELETKDKIVHDSVFSLTINPNISSDKDSEFHKKYHDKLLAGTNAIFGDDERFLNNFITYMKEGEGRDKVISMDGDLTLEYGRTKKWHVQAAIDIKHRTMLRLNKNRLVEEYAKICNVPASAIHIDIKVAGWEKKTDAQKIKNYVLKSRVKTVVEGKTN